MKREEEGLVIDITGDIAKIKVGRHNECSNCGACPGDNTMVMSVKNSTGAKPGQRVAFEVKEAGMLKSAFIVFILPIIAATLGAFVGGWIGKSIGISRVICEIVVGTIAFLGSVRYIRYFDKSVNDNIKIMPKITRIIS